MNNTENSVLGDMSEIEKTLHSAKLNYLRLGQTLSKLIHTERLLENKDTINLYIDVFSVMKNLYKSELEDQISNVNIYDRYMLVSEIINIVGHYRHFFYSRLKKYTNVILFYSDKESSYCTNILPEYKTNYYNKYIRFGNENKASNRILMNTISLVKSFMEYIPHAYVINTGTVEPRGYIRYLIDETPKEEYNLIITNDQLYYDMIGYKNNISILHLKGENSKNIYMGNVYEYLTKEIKKEIDFPSNYLIPLVLSYKNNSTLNITYGKRSGIYKAIKNVNDLIESNKLSTSIEYNPETLKLIIQDFELLDNYKVVSSKNLSQHISPSELDYIEMQFVDRNDFKGVKEVCNAHFKKNEVIIPFLYDGEMMV